MTASRAIRHATRDELLAWYGHDVPRARAWVIAEESGEVLGIFGICRFHNGALQAFEDHKPELEEDKPTMLRAARKFVKMVTSAGENVTAIPNENYPWALDNMRRFGFLGDGPVYVRYSQ